MRKIIKYILLIVCVFTSGSLFSQDTIYPNDPDDGFMIPRISLTSENLIAYNGIYRIYREGMVFSPADRGEKIYGFAVSGTWLDTSHTLYGYLFQKVGNEYVAVDSVNMKHVSRNRKLMVPFISHPGSYDDYQEYCDRYDSLTNPEYYCCTIQEYYFHDGYPIDSDSFAIAIGTVKPCCDNRLCLYRHIIFNIHIADTPDNFFVFDSLGNVYINYSREYLHWYYFPITSRELWLEHVTSHCEGVAGLRSEDVDGRTARLRWSGVGGHAAYEVAVGLADSAGDDYTVYSVADTEFLYHNMDYGVDYAFRVRGLCRYEDTIETWSPWSDTVQFARPSFHLTVLSNDDSLGVAHGTGAYEPFTDVTIEALPADKGVFLRWNDSVQDNPRTFTITQDTSFMAVFALDSAWIQGIVEVGSLDFTVAPNPTTGRLTVTMPLAAGTPALQVTLMDMSGRTLLSAKADGQVVEMDISALPAGQYLLMVRGKEHWGVRTVIKN